MKHIFVYIFMITLVVFMVILINKNQNTIQPKLLSVNTYYSYLDEIGEDCYIDFYLNTKDHPMVDVNSYQNLKLHNQEYSKSIELELNNVIFLHQETYLNETYYKYSYVFNMPLLGYDFDIESSYLEISLVNEDLYDIFIGSISFKTIDEDESFINWTALSGRKEDNQYLSRLYEIDIEYNELLDDIKQISVGNLFNVSFEVYDEIIKITIPYKNELFYACPIFITFDDNQINTINYFVYMKDYETLKQSGQLIYHYALN
ncbi:hypothetical protein [Mariniplasma anaerobium]|uniref:Uncharacterized protein n=1 Tax=Mariniplasma anaerobium TaxID=2735436 RepID=A0A7U9XVV5_9MOLU|nr:hypothetical protein [Mariniplasma anaerobium]BCR36034.1 hypothetical protein MPAN_009270 [Mariniplasma anaerobium]